ncbi:ThiF family adenylyltransferase [Microbacterium halotolerans]|uniref:ThiF family adenylyltransferase n=1 Tax=Microbacterium halotolerans TaxID=246613 RepID=UPI000E6AA678|nr:ThiF family adenylyltransferase [Microbacterium halotolerans]
MPFPPLVDPVASLSETERSRTARHLALAGFGDDAQRRLANAHVALVGAGGLGSPAVLALAAAGVGTLTVIDDDVVEVSNLQRQVMHRHDDVGEPKALSAVRAAADLSPETSVRTVIRRLDASNAVELLTGADVVLDGADTFETRVDVAAACEELGVPLVWGVIQEFSAQLTVFWSTPPDGRSPVLLSDLYPAGSAGEVPTCAQVGVLGAMCLQVGAAMAMQAIQLIAGIGEPLLGRVLLFDALRSRSREVPLVGAATPTRDSADDDAPEPSPSVPFDVDAPVPGRAARSSDSTTAQPQRARSIRARDLETFLTADAAQASPVLLDVRELDEVAADNPFPDAVSIRFDEVMADPAAAAARLGDRRAAVLCRSGVRSKRAAAALAATGVDCVSVAGGLDAWHAAADRSAAR